jgi:flagellar basal body-associated protein FliL
MTQPPYPPGPPQPGQNPYQQPYQPGPQQPYQASFTAPPAPQKKGKGCLIAAIIVAVILVAVVVGVVVAIAAIGKGVSDATTGEHTITFKVETTAKTMVIYGTTSGTAQETVTTSWTKEKKVTGIDGATVIASLDSDAPDNATISCEILIDGKSKSKESGTGKSASVSCAAATVK